MKFYGDATQEIVNAQVSVNRAVFECNRPGEADRRKRREPDQQYIFECVSQAIEDLAAALKVMVGVRRGAFGGQDTPRKKVRR